MKSLDTNLSLEKDFYPTLYEAANRASIEAQKKYYVSLAIYLVLLIIAGLCSYLFVKSQIVMIISTMLFLITLGILVWIKLQKPETIWYNGRAVAESVKTRTWRWIMKADPFDKAVSEDKVEKDFLADLRQILTQNIFLSAYLVCTPTIGDAITNKMKTIRETSTLDRLEIYKTKRIDDQASWYSIKAKLNKDRSKQWFIVSVFLHLTAIGMLLYQIMDPKVSLPIQLLATTASATITWVQAKKHNELKASYALTAHEIVLIKAESSHISSEEQLSEFIVDSEAAFSREHTQWVARKND